MKPKEDVTFTFYIRYLAFYILFAPLCAIQNCSTSYFSPSSLTSRPPFNCSCYSASSSQFPFLARRAWAGHVVGSNIFNILAILGTASVVSPMAISDTIIWRELPAVMVMSLVVFPMLRTGWSVQRWEGFILLGAYLGLAAWLL